MATLLTQMRGLLTAATLLCGSLAVVVAEASPALAVANRGYVSNIDSGTVTAFDVTTNKVVATIPVGTSPAGLAVSPSGLLLLVARGGAAGRVSIVDTTANIVVASVPVGDTPGEVAITPNGSRAYVTNVFSDDVSVIRLDSVPPKVIATIKVGHEPEGVAISRDGTRVYVSNFQSGTLSVVATATNSVVATVDVGGGVDALAVTPDGSRVYATNTATDSVSVVSTATNTVTATVKVGDDPQGIAITPTGSKAYVTNSGSDTVSVISTSSQPNKVIATIAGVGRLPLGVGISPDGTRAFVASLDSDAVWVLNTSLDARVAVIGTGSPFGVAIGPGPPPDVSPPTVTINQGSRQSDPSSSSPITFVVRFSEPVDRFGGLIAVGDTSLGGTAQPRFATATGSGAEYVVSVSGMTRSGTVTATIPHGAAVDAAGNPSRTSTSTDNVVEYVFPSFPFAGQPALLLPL